MKGALLFLAGMFVAALIFITLILLLDIFPYVIGPTGYVACLFR